MVSTEGRVCTGALPHEGMSRERVVGFTDARLVFGSPSITCADAATWNR